MPGRAIAGRRERPAFQTAGHGSGIGPRTLMRPCTTMDDEYQNEFWGLTTVATWALTRERVAVRVAADPTSDNALFEVRAAHLAWWHELNERLWRESGWAKPNDGPLAIEVYSRDVADEVTMIPPPSDERYAERLRQLEAEGKIRIRRDNSFPINDFLLFGFQTGKLTAVRNPPGEAGARELSRADWASLEIVGGDHERLFVRRRRATGSRAPDDVRVDRATVLEVFPEDGVAPAKTPQLAKRSRAQRKVLLQDAAAEALVRLCGSERPMLLSRKEILDALRVEFNRPSLSLKTLERAMKLAWPSASSERVK